MAGSHDGYSALTSPARHSRSILYLRHGYWVVRDQVESSGAHDVAIRFHCDPRVAACLARGTTPDAASAEICDRDTRVPLLRVSVFGQHGTLAVDDGWVSRQYGSRTPSRVITWRQHGTGAQELVTFLFPEPSSERRIAGEAREVADVAGGRAFVVRTRQTEDLLLLGDGRPLRTEGVETDAEWLWLRHDRSGQLADYIAIGASRARVDGRDLWAKIERVDWRSSAETESQAPRETAISAPSLINTGSGAT